SKVDAAAHAARVGPHRAIRSLGQLEPLEQLGRPRRALAAGQVDEPSDQAQVLTSREVAVDGRVLTGQADRAPDGLGVPDDVVAEHLRPPAVRSQDGRENADRRGLAGAVRAEQAEDRPGADLEVDARQGGHGSEVLGQALDPDRGFAHLRTLRIRALLAVLGQQAVERAPRAPEDLARLGHLALVADVRDLAGGHRHLPDLADERGDVVVHRLAHLLPRRDQPVTALGDVVPAGVGQDERTPSLALLRPYEALVL